MRSKCVLCLYRISEWFIRLPGHATIYVLGASQSSDIATVDRSTTVVSKTTVEIFVGRGDNFFDLIN